MIGDFEIAWKGKPHLMEADRSWHSDPPTFRPDPPRIGFAFARFCWNEPIVKDSAVLQRVTTPNQGTGDRIEAVGCAIAPPTSAPCQS